LFNVYHYNYAALIIIIPIDPAVFPREPCAEPDLSESDEFAGVEEAPVTVTPFITFVGCI
jgi:hypothetical protein